MQPVFIDASSALPNDTRPFVLHVRVVNGSGGGPDKTILRSAKYVDPSRIRMAAAYIHPNSDKNFDTIKEHARKENCALWCIGESSAIDPRTVRSLVKLCKQQRVTIWHGHDYKSNLLGLLVNKMWPMKLVTTVHGWTWDTVRTRFYYHVDNWCLPHYQQIVVVSPKLYEHCLNNGVPAERLTYIPNAIRPEEFSRKHSAHEARDELGIDNDALVIGVIGRLSVEKGVDRAIDLLAAIRPAYPNAQLHLVGDGPERKKLQQQTARLGLEKNVRFWGWQKQSQRFYEAMDMLLLPSHTEGLPNVVLEAMAMQTPVAATDVGGVRDLLAHGSCGVVLSNEQPQTWAADIRKLLASADLRSTLAGDALQRIETHFTFERRMQKMTRVYQQVLPFIAQQAA